MPRHTFSAITVLGLLSVVHALYFRHCAEPRPRATVAARQSARVTPPPSPARPEDTTMWKSSPPGPPAAATKGTIDLPPDGTLTAAAGQTEEKPDQPLDERASPLAADSGPPAGTVAGEPFRAVPGSARSQAVAAADSAPGAPHPATTDFGSDEERELVGPITRSRSEAAEQPPAAARRDVPHRDTSPDQLTIEPPSQGQPGARSPQTAGGPLGADHSIGPSRLPPLTTPARPPAAIPDSAPAPARPVQLASGAVAVVVPPEWQATEIPGGPPVRLLITPRRCAAAEEAIEGVWVTYHARSVTDEDSYTRLQALCEQSLRRAAGAQAVLGPPTPVLVDTWPGIRVNFQWPARGPHQSGLRGFRAMIRTASGICEVHAMAPEAVYAQRSAEFEQLLAGIRLRPATGRVAEAVQAASGILGLWKATDQRLQLDPDGLMAFADETWTASTGVVSHASGRAARPARSRTGTFRASNDLLQVAWSDGTRAIYRWRVWNGRLMLTDDGGRMVILCRTLNARL